MYWSPFPTFPSPATGENFEAVVDFGQFEGGAGAVALGFCCLYEGVVGLTAQPPGGRFL